MAIEEALLILWAAWAGAHLILFALGALLVRPENTPHYNGFTIIVPARVRRMLPADEFNAVMEHERGHARMFHVWYNLARVCFLVPVSVEELQAQELAADDCAQDPAALARAMRRMGAYTPFDVYRVERLERRAQGSQDASNLTPGMGDHGKGR